MESFLVKLQECYAQFAGVSHNGTISKQMIESDKKYISEICDILSVDHSSFDALAKCIEIISGSNFNWKTRKILNKKRLPWHLFRRMWTSAGLGPGVMSLYLCQFTDLGSGLDSDDILSIFKVMCLHDTHKLNDKVHGSRSQSHGPTGSVEFAKKHEIECSYLEKLLIKYHDAESDEAFLKFQKEAQFVEGKTWDEMSRMLWIVKASDRCDSVVCQSLEQKTKRITDMPKFKTALKNLKGRQTRSSKSLNIFKELFPESNIDFRNISVHKEICFEWMTEDYYQNLFCSD